MHRNHLKHSNFENCWFRYVIYLGNHKKIAQKQKLAPKNSRWKFLSPERFTKKNYFLANFCARTGKKYRGGVHSILMPPTLHIAHLNCHSRIISEVPLRLTWCQGFSARACQSRVTQIRAHKNWPFWDVFWTKQIFLAKRSIFAYSVFQFPESYCCKGSYRIFGDHLRASCDPSDFLYLLGSELTLLAETMS